MGGFSGPLDENTVENTDENTDENDQTNSIDLVSIKLGDKFKLVLGMKHVKIFKVESENEERIIFKVSVFFDTFTCSRDPATNSETANPDFFSVEIRSVYWD